MISENDLNKVIFLLFSNKYSDICENNYYLKTQYKYKFEEEALFNSENQEIQTGKIISFFNYNENNQSELENYMKMYGIIIEIPMTSKFYYDNNVNYFDKHLFKYHRNQNKKYKDILIIKDDMLKAKFYKVSSIEIKKISQIIIAKDDNEYQKIFIRNNSNILINIIKEAIRKNNLNEKGLCFLLKLINKLIKYLNKEEILLILKYIANYYEKNKQEENKYIFLSFELIDEIMDKYYDFYYKCYLNIYQEKTNKEQTIFNIFNIFIKKESLGFKLKTTNDIKYYKNCLKKPINDINNDILDIYNNSFKLNNISLYKCHNIYDKQLIYDNSVLFTNSINNANDLLDISKIIEENNNKIKVVIVNEMNEYSIQSNLIEFINKYSIPIYKLDKNIYNIFINFFIEGIIANYISLKNIYGQNIVNEDKKDENNIIDIYKFDFNIDLNQNYNQIYEPKGDNQTILKIFEVNRNIIYNCLINDINKIYKLLNIKLIKRLIYELITIDDITFSDIKNIFNYMKNIVYIFESICMEYYFNVQHNISNVLLKKNMKKYFFKMSFKEKNEEINKNNWLVLYINDFTKNNYFKQFSGYNEYLANYKLLSYNLKNENKLFTDYLNSYDNIANDILLYISKKFSSIKNKEYLIKIFINLIKKNIQNIILKKDRVVTVGVLNYGTIDKDYFSSLFLYEIFKVLYDYFFDNHNNIKLFDYFTSDKIDKNLEDLIKNYINLDVFFNNRNKKENLFTQKISYLIQFIFKYFDFCLVLFLKENKKTLFEFWVKSKCKLFNFYCDYKILSIKKNYQKKDIKEMMSFIAYLTDNTNDNKQIKNIKNKFEMKINKFNEFKIDNKNEFNDLTIKFKNLDENETYYYKIAVFFKNNDNNYILHDIINLKDIRNYSDNSYILKTKQDVYFIPLKYISTFIYSFEHNPFYNNNDIVYKNFKKNENVPKYCWNLGFHGNKFLLLSEENNQIYTNEKSNSSIEEKFIIEEKINKFSSNQNEIKDEIIDFVNFDPEFSSFLLTKTGKIYCIEKETEKKNMLPWFLLKYIYSKEYPLYMEIIPDIKIKYMSPTLSDCYIINFFGNLYGTSYQNLSVGINKLYNISWVNIPLPPNNKKFLQCFSGPDHLLCLIENNTGKKKIYARGYNNVCQCGITNKNNNPPFFIPLDILLQNQYIYYNDVYIKDLTKCDKLEGIEFKSIYVYICFSAGITTSGVLYTWGLYRVDVDINLINLEKPCLVKK